MEQVEIFCTTCRDGEQGIEQFKDSNSKLLIAKAMAKLGVSTIEAGFPSSSDQEFQTVEQIANEVQGPYICGLAGLNKYQIERAWDAIKTNKHPTLHIFSKLVDSESLTYFDFNQIMKDAIDATKFSKDLMQNKGRLEFSAQNATIADPNKMSDLYNAVINEGVNIINLPDTTGYSLPSEITSFIKSFKEQLQNPTLISIHCHNDLGLATANTLAAIESGARQVECTFHGIGERAGNTALEQIAMLIKKRLNDKFYTTIDTTKFDKDSQLIEEHSLTKISPHTPILGSNIFTHRSGFHQHGTRVGNLYQILNPEEIGREPSIEETYRINSKSGKSGFFERLIHLGYEPENLKIYIQAIVEESKRISNDKGSLSDIDMRFIADKIISPLEERLTYQDKTLELEIKKGVSQAKVPLYFDGNLVIGKAESTGSINALFTAIDDATGLKIPTLLDYLEVNLEKAHSSVGEVTVTLSENGREKRYLTTDPIYIGIARDERSLEASIKAYVYAVNRYIKQSIEQKTI